MTRAKGKMTRRRLRPLTSLLLALAAVVAGTGPVLAQGGAAKPARNDNRFHKEYVEVARKGQHAVVFTGDSITYGWGRQGKEVWDKTFAPLKAVNFGIGGNRTQHVLWRLQNGELEGNPKVIVLMVGTNNLLGKDPPDEVAAGIKAILDTIRRKQPQTKVLLLGILPCGSKPPSKAGDRMMREKVKAVNQRIARFADGMTVRFLDAGDRFLEGGGLKKEAYSGNEQIHLSRKGYEMWAEAIAPVLTEMLK